MFNIDIIDFSKSSSPFTKTFLTCGGCGVGVASLQRVVEAMQLILFPVGCIIDYHAPLVEYEFQIPDGWSICDGRSYLPQSYPVLHSMLKTGNLPDLTGKINTMKDYTEFGLLSDISDNTDILGTEVGIYEEVMVEDNIPLHNHTFKEGRRWGGPEFGNDANDGGNAMLPKDVFDATLRETSPEGEVNPDPISNRQPTITVLKIIKVE